MTDTSGRLSRTELVAPGEIPGTAQVPRRPRQAEQPEHPLGTNGHGGYGSDIDGFKWPKLLGGRRDGSEPVTGAVNAQHVRIGDGPPYYTTG